MGRNPFETLARLVQTLALGREVSTTFVMGQRATEWQERFLLASDPIDGDLCVFHGGTTRRNGVEQRQRDEPTDWSLGAMLKWIVELDEADETVVEAQLVEFAMCGPTAQAIADMADASDATALIAGSVWTRTGDAEITCAGAGASQWTLDHTVMAIRQGR